MEYEIVIIGAGPAGIATAEYFLKCKKKVLILESGNEELIKSYATNNDSFEGDFDINFLEERKRAFFGTTSLWKTPGVGGTFFEFDKIDFEQNSFLKWGIKFKEIKDIYLDAWKYLGLNSEELQSTLNIKNFQWQKLMNEYYLKKGSSYYTFGRNYENFILKKKKNIFESNNIKIIFNSNLKKIILNREKNSVEKIIALNENQQKLVFRCKNLVLACGCFENSKILKNVQNEYKININDIGKYITYHPSLSIGKINLKDFPSFNKNEIKELSKSFILKNKLKKGEQIINYGISLSPITNLPFIKESILKKIDKLKNNISKREIRLISSNFSKLFLNLDLFRYLAYKLKILIFGFNINKINVSVVFEHLPIRESCIELDHRNSLSFHNYLSKKNIDSLQKVVFQNQSIFRKVFINFVPREIDFSDLRFDTNNHHHGGTIIGNEKNGLLDINLKVNNVDNLYVTGSSIFPNSSIYNPTLTIIAFSLRLSKYLFDKVK